MFCHNPFAAHRATPRHRIRATLAGAALAVFALGAAAGATGETLAAPAAPALSAASAPAVVLTASEAQHWAGDARHVHYVWHVCATGQHVKVPAAIRRELGIPRHARALMCVTPLETVIVQMDQDGQIARDWSA